MFTIEDAKLHILVIESGQRREIYCDYTAIKNASLSARQEHQQSHLTPQQHSCFYSF